MHHFSLILFPLINGHSTGNVKNKNQTKTNQFLPQTGPDAHPRWGSALVTLSTVFPPLLLIQSFGHELRTGMVNKEVMVGRESGEGQREGRTDSRPPLAGGWEGSVQRKGLTRGGTLSLRGSLEPRCLREIFTCIRHAGARRAPGGCWASALT